MCGDLIDSMMRWLCRVSAPCAAAHPVPCLQARQGDGLCPDAEEQDRSEPVSSWQEMTSRGTEQAWGSRLNSELPARAALSGEWERVTY